MIMDEKSVKFEHILLVNLLRGSQVQLRMVNCGEDSLIPTSILPYFLRNPKKLSSNLPLFTYITNFDGILLFPFSPLFLGVAVIYICLFLKTNDLSFVG
jgi:hypothetical protein